MSGVVLICDDDPEDRAALRHPATVRFLVSGDEIEHLNAALDEGAVHRYFAKPHDAERLRSQLEKSLRDRTLRIPRFKDV